MISTILGLPGTLCPPEVFAPMHDALDGQLDLVPVSWLTGDGPWDIPSIADDIADQISSRDAGPVLVCGHSTGGAIALQLALTAPDLVSGLLLVNTGPNTHEHGDVERILHTVRNEWGSALHASVLDRSFHQPLKASVRERMLQWNSMVSQRAVDEVLTSQHALDFSQLLDRIDVPAIVLHGIHDRVRSPERAAEFATALPHGQLRLVDAGHTPVYEAPSAAADAAVALARRVGRQPDPRR